MNIQFPKGVFPWTLEIWNDLFDSKNKKMYSKKKILT